MGLWGPCRAMGSAWGYGVHAGLWGLYGTMGSVWGYGVAVWFPPSPSWGRPYGAAAHCGVQSCRDRFSADPVGPPLFLIGSHRALCLLLWGLRSVCCGVSALLWGLHSVMGSPLCYGVSRAAVFTAHPSPAGLTALSGTWGNGGAAGGGTALPPPKPPPAVGPPSGGWVMAAILWGGLSAALPFAPHTQMGP